MALNKAYVVALLYKTTGTSTYLVEYKDDFLVFSGDLSQACVFENITEAILLRRKVSERYSHKGYRSVVLSIHKQPSEILKEFNVF